MANGDLANTVLARTRLTGGEDIRGGYDDINALADLLATSVKKSTADTAWTAIAYLSGFTSAGAPGQLRYRAFNGAVWITGSAYKSAAFASGTYVSVTAAGALPAALRPSVNSYFGAAALGGAGALIEVDADGTIKMAFNNNGGSTTSRDWVGGTISYPIGM